MHMYGKNADEEKDVLMYALYRSSGAAYRNRTYNLLITNQLLCQLS